MRTNAVGVELFRVDDQINVDTFISGYKYGIETSQSSYGVPTANYYSGSISNCSTAVYNTETESQSGLMFTRFLIDGDIGVYSPLSDQIYSQYHTCQINGRTGPAAWLTAPAGMPDAWMQFQNCTISNTMQLDGGVFNLVNCSLYAPTQCVMSANATRAAFTGCTFVPSTNVVNSGESTNLLIDGRGPISNSMPIINWTNILNDYANRHPTSTNLYLVTAYGAVGDGTNDDTSAIQSALAAAGSNGGGIVYLPAGKYHLTNTLDVPSGVELRGTFEILNGSGNWLDGKAHEAVSTGMLGPEKLKR